MTEPKIRKQMGLLTPEERNRLLKLNDEWTPIFTILSLTGMKISEALGLDWSNVDLETNEIRITRRLKRITGQGLQYKNLDKNKSYRIIPISQRTVTALRIQQLQAKVGPDDLVFPNERGEPMDQAKVNRALKTSLLKIGVFRHLSLQDLRHTAGSIMIQSGANPKTVQIILGHQTVATTIDLYVEASNTMIRKAIEKSDQVGSARKSMKGNVPYLYILPRPPTHLV